MNPTCAEHRTSMMLLALRRRLAEQDLTPEERRRLEDEIALLEKELRMD